MASENLEDRQGRASTAFNADGVDGILPFIHPDFEATTPPELAAEPDTYRGHEGVRRYFDSFYEIMDEIRFEPGTTSTRWATGSSPTSPSRHAARPPGSRSARTP